MKGEDIPNTHGISQAIKLPCHFTKDTLFLVFFLFWRSESLHQTHRPHQKRFEFTQFQGSEIGHLYRI